MYATATILDPGFKVEYFRDRQDCVTVKRNFYQDAESYGKYSEKSISKPPIQDIGYFSWIDRLFKKSQLSNVHEEVKRYLSEPIIRKNQTLCYTGKKTRRSSLVCMLWQ